MGKLTGRITEFLGQWTNDRETEARGRAELKNPDPDAPVPSAADRTVQAEEERVRREVGEQPRRSRVGQGAVEGAGDLAGGVDDATVEARQVAEAVELGLAHEVEQHERPAVGQGGDGAVEGAAEEHPGPGNGGGEVL